MEEIIFEGFVISLTGCTNCDWENASWDNNICLLYTSDAADERSSVDLGGRRIIKKQKNR